MTQLRWNRREFIGATASLLVGSRCIAHQDKAPTPDHITPQAQQAIDRGLLYLARSQAADGSFGDRPQLIGNVAVTSLAGLAFLAGGQSPDRGKFGPTVTRTINYILSQESNSTPGFLYHPIASTHGPMYSHGFGTLLLGESYGLIDDDAMSKRVRATLERAVQLILACQNAEGGWRYRPVREQADISVTVSMIMALRSARNAGLAVPKSAVTKCVDYVRQCQDSRTGGFRYFRNTGDAAFPRSAAGLCALYSAGEYQGKDIDRALNYLMRFKPGSNAIPPDTHYYYGHYYAAQAMWTAGDPRWSEWFPALRDDLLKGRQRSDGAFNDGYFGNDYATAMACIILQIPNNYLPILQK
jgi:prenyltransferase beta subunit